MMSGFPLRHGYANLKNPQNVFPAIRKALKYAPIPVLYYALQYTEKKFIQRIGQEYTAQPKIDEDGMIILSAMENAYFQNVQTHSKNSITVFLSEYINVIDQDIWTKLFTKIWLDKKNKNALFADNHRIDTTFIEKSITLLTDAKTMVFLINDCLDAILNNSSDIQSPSINYLYQLTQNPYYSENEKIIKECIDITLLEQLFDQLYTEPNRLFIVGYVMNFIPAKLSKNIKEIINSWDLGNISNERTWSVISYFIKQDSVLQRKVINAIINSKNLWNAGIKGNKISGGNRYIPLRQLRKSSNSDYGLKLKKAEASQIFNKLTFTLSQIEKSSGQGKGILNFNFILQEMIWFLEDEKRLLKDQQDYNDVITKAKSIFEEEKGGLDLFNGLLSNTVEDINWAIMEISRQLYDLNRFKEHKKHLEIILHRILCKNPVGLELCLNYLANWFYNFKDKQNLKIYKIEATEILKVYYNNYPDNCDSAYIEELLIRIAYVLNYWEINDSIIVKYLNLLEKSRYNSIKYILKLNLNGDK